MTKENQFNVRLNLYELQLLWHTLTEEIRRERRVLKKLESNEYSLVEIDMQRHSLSSLEELKERIGKAYRNQQGKKQQNSKSNDK